MTATLSRAQVEALRAYLQELQRWNRRLNLTSVPAERAWQKHVEESLRLLDAADAAEGQRLVDVGSGSGAPGLIVAVARPDLEVTLLESDTRKAAFLTHASGSLGLSNVLVVASRAEDAGHDPAMREHFDLGLSRAAASPPVLLELALPLVAVGGRLCALVADAARAATVCSQAAASLGGGEPATMGDDILMVFKRSPTVMHLPRRTGVPSRRPLA